MSPGIGAEDFTVAANTSRVCPVLPNKDTKAAALSNLPPLFDNRNLGPFKATAYVLGPKTQEIADQEAKEYADKLAATEKAAAESSKGRKEQREENREENKEEKKKKGEGSSKGYP